MEICARSVSHTFRGEGRPDVAVLDRLSLEVSPGEFVAMVGPSGAGKSTLLRMFAGMLEPDSGTVEIGGTPVAGRTDLVAYQPQRDLLLPWKRVLDNTTLAAEAAGIPKAEARAMAREALDRFGLGDFADSWPTELSGGMRQRVALLRTHLSPRPVMLLDEPLGSLDALTRRTMQRWVAQLQAAHRRSTLLVTHDIEEALILADRVVVLSQRPATVVAEFQSPWPHPRLPRLELTPDFVKLRTQVVDALSSDGDAHGAQAGEPAVPM